MLRIFKLLFACAAALAPQFASSEDRPGFFSPEFGDFEIRKHTSSLVYTETDSTNKTVSTDNFGVSYPGRGSAQGITTSFNYNSPHVDNISMGISLSRSEDRSTYSSAGHSGTANATNNNSAETMSFGLSYLLNDDTILNAFFVQDHASAVRQTQKTFHLDLRRKLAPNLQISSRLGGLIDDPLLENGIKHVSAGIEYRSSNNFSDASALVDIHSATMTRRSYVSGTATASEDKFNGIGIAGSINIRNAKSRYGIVGTYSQTNQLGRPLSFSLGPRYIYTGADIEIMFTAVRKITRMDNIGTVNGIVDYRDNVSQEILISLTKEFAKEYFIRASMTKRQIEDGNTVLGTTVDQSLTKNDTVFDLAVIKQF